MQCEGNEVEMCDGEILDELTTNRGELKVRTMSFNEDKHSQVLLFLIYVYFFRPVCLYHFFLVLLSCPLLIGSSKGRCMTRKNQRVF